MRATIAVEPPSPKLMAELAPFLGSVLEAARFDDPTFVNALYLDAPRAPLLAQARIDGRVVGHQALLWMQMRTSSGTTLAASLSVNSAAAREIRGSGVYPDLVLTLAGAAVDAGTLCYYGVTNEGSMKATTRLGGKVVAQLPIHVLDSAARPQRGWRHRPVTQELLDGDVPERVAEDADRRSRFGVRTGWNAELLRWRLSIPGTPMTLHEHPRFWVLTAVRKVRGIPVVVLAKVWAREEPEVPERFPASAVAAIARHHRTPAVIHVGLNADVRFLGVPVPRRFRPAPLYLTYFANPGVVATQEVDFDCFEPLDFDAL
ncbi:MAG: hypothetical protein R2754_00520 [Microthrixaceae bacterium]